MRVVVAVSICVVAFTAGCSNGGRSTLTLGQSSWATDWPPQAARPVDVVRARRIIERNPGVRALLGSNARPSGSFVWLKVNGEPPVVVLRYPLPTGTRIDTVVPYAVNPPDAPASGDCEQPYAAGWKRLRAEHVTRLFVAVDLDKRRIADISTDAKKQVVSRVSGRPFPTCEAS